MIVIEHIKSGEKMMYPNHNINKETPTGFIQYPSVPREFRLAADQTPVPIQYFNQIKYSAQNKDPLNQYDWNDKIW